MQRKKIPISHNKMNIQQVIEDMANPQTQQPMMQKPVSAGGTSVTPITMTQEHLQFVDGIDEVPEWLRGEVWALVTRMNQLTYIDSDYDFERMLAGVRSQLRPLYWKRKISLLEMQQIEYFVGVQLRKSKLGKERKYIVPGYQDITHSEISNTGSVIDESQHGFAAHGLAQKMPRRRNER